MGIFASGSPALASEGASMIALYGQVVGALVMAVLGFVPGYLVSPALKKMGLLRAPREAEMMGLDRATILVIGAGVKTRALLVRHAQKETKFLTNKNLSRHQHGVVLSFEVRQTDLHAWLRPQRKILKS